MPLNPAMLQDTLTGIFPDTIKVTVPAVAVYLLTQRSINKHKEQTMTAREEAKKEITEALGPALRTFKAELTAELLKSTSDTYVRAEEARLQFTNISKVLERLEKNQDSLNQTVNNLAASIGRRKNDG